jgi:hypothetical protein
VSLSLDIKAFKWYAYHIRPIPYATGFGSGSKERELILWLDTRRHWGLVVLGVVLSAVMTSHSALAASGAYNYGQVIAVRSCPDVFVIANRTVFTIVEPVAGAEMVDREIVAGDFQYGGITTILNTSRNNEPIKVIVLATLLSDRQFHADLPRYCHWLSDVEKYGQQWRGRKLSSAIRFQLELVVSTP